MMNKVQADIAYGFTTIVRSDPRYYAYTIMNNALGQYGIGGRLGDSIRERQGMAYYVFSSFDANVVEGPLLVRAGVNPANVERAIRSIDEEITRMATEGLTPGELDDCKQYLIGSIPRLLETNSAIATFLQTSEFFGLGLDHDLRLPNLLGSVTLEDVNAAARATLDVNRASRRGCRSVSKMTQAVFFDVDFTLIYPGPAFQGEGYQAFCSRYGIEVEPQRFTAAVNSASHILDREQDAVYNPQIFIDYTAHIIRHMGGTGDAVEHAPPRFIRSGRRASTSFFTRMCRRHCTRWPSGTCSWG